MKVKMKVKMGGRAMDLGKIENIRIISCNLNKIDFYPFKNNSAKMAMTAHILYRKIDIKIIS